MGHLVNGRLGQGLPILEEQPEDCLPGERFMPGRGCVPERKVLQSAAEAWLARNWIYVAAGLAGLLLVGRRR